MENINIYKIGNTIINEINNYFANYIATNSHSDVFDKIIVTKSNFQQIITKFIPLIKIVNNNYDKYVHIEKIEPQNKKMLNYAKRSNILIENNKIPYIILQKIGYDIVMYMIERDNVALNTYNKIFNTGYDDEVRNKFPLLKIANMYIRNGGQFFEQTSTKYIVNMINKDGFMEDSFLLVDLINSTYRNRDEHESDASKAIGDVNSLIKHIIEKHDNNDTLIPNYPQTIRIAILLSLGNLIMNSEYISMRLWFLSVKKNLKYNSSITSDGASLLHWYYALFMLDNVYNSMMCYDYYDTNCWN